MSPSAYQGNNENRWILLSPSYDELRRIVISEALWISADWNKGMCPDGNGAKQKLEYTWLNGAKCFIQSNLYTMPIPGTK